MHSKNPKTGCRLFRTHHVSTSYVKIVATGAKGGTYTVFSDRFSYSGMTASFSSAFTAAMKDVTGTSGPSAVDTTVKDAADASSVADDAFDVEYTMQTGATRYAPMQPVPLTKITAKNPKPQYPTSSVKIANKPLPIPTIATTITQSQTHKVSSIENTVSDILDRIVAKPCLNS